MVVKDGIETRLADSIETGLELADGNITVDVIDGETLNFLRITLVQFAGSLLVN